MDARRTVSALGSGQSHVGRGCTALGTLQRLQDLFELSAEALEQFESPTCALGGVLPLEVLAVRAMLARGLGRAAFLRRLFALFAACLIHASLRRAA